MNRERTYGIMAEFDSPTALVEAARLTHQAGYSKIDAYSPFPIEGLAEEIGFHHDEGPLVVLIVGIESPLLPDRVFLGSKIRSRWYARFPASPAPTLSFGGPQLICCPSIKRRQTR